MALALLLSVPDFNFERFVQSAVPAGVSRATLQMQPFVLAMASDSAGDSDTVACVTDQCQHSTRRGAP